jgi:hypothetical protein
VNRIPKNEKLEKFMDLIDKWKPKEAFASVSPRFIKKDKIRRLTDIRIRHQGITPAVITDLFWTE